MAAATELTVCIMSVRNDFSQVSAVSPTASALTLQTIVSMPPSSTAALSIRCLYRLIKLPAVTDRRPDRCLHFRPVARAFERSGGAVDDGFVVILADQH